MATWRRIVGVSVTCGLAWSVVVLCLNFLMMWYLGRSSSFAPQAYSVATAAMINLLLLPGVLLSPLIGLAAGLASQYFPKKSRVGGAIFALVSLYTTAALFGLAMSLFGFGMSLFGFVATGNTEDFFAVILLPVAGLTVYGFFIVLWPLAYFNHRYVARLWAKNDLADSAMA